jgi:hypothetical protein
VFLYLAYKNKPVNQISQIGKENTSRNIVQCILICIHTVLFHFRNLLIPLENVIFVLVRYGILKFFQYIFFQMIFTGRISSSKGTYVFSALLPLVVKVNQLVGFKFCAINVK